MAEHQVGKAAKYQVETERLVEELDASFVILIVRDGSHGNGMALAVKRDRAPQMAGPHQPEILAVYLRGLADMIDAGVRPEGVHVITKE